jgi:hypothetical protein
MTNRHREERPVPDRTKEPAAVPELLTVPEAAAILHSTPHAVYNALRRLQLPPDLICRPLGMRTIRIRKDRLIAHIEASTEAPELQTPAFIHQVHRRRR